MVAFRLNRSFHSEDFSIPRLMEGQVMFSNDEWHQDFITQLSELLKQKHTTVVEKYDEARQSVTFEELFKECAAHYPLGSQR